MWMGWRLGRSIGEVGGGTEGWRGEVVCKKHCWEFCPCISRQLDALFLYPFPSLPSVPIPAFATAYPSAS